MVNIRCWNDHITVRMCVEVDKWSAFLLRPELATLGTFSEGRIMGLCSSARIKVGVWVGNGVAASGWIVDEGLILAPHLGEGGSSD